MHSMADALDGRCTSSGMVEEAVNKMLEANSRHEDSVSEVRSRNAQNITNVRSGGEI